MNKYTQESFTKIKSAAESYERTVSRALEVYRETMSKVKAEAAQYKDESAYISERKAKAATDARKVIRRAEADFRVAVKTQVIELKDELHRHLIAPPPEAFVRMIKSFSDFNFPPSFPELDALRVLAGGNNLALRTLNSVLQKTNSKWRVKAPGAEDYEADLKALENLVDGNIMYSPSEYHHEAVELFADTPIMKKREDGSLYDSGLKHNSVSILVAGENFKEKIQALDTMATRWSDSVVPTIFDTNVYGKTTSGAEEFLNDRDATAQSAEIVNNPDAAEELTAQEAQERAALDAKAREIVSLYTSKAGGL